MLFDISKIEALVSESENHLDNIDVSFRSIRRFFDRLNFVDDVATISIAVSDKEVCNIAMVFAFQNLFEESIKLVNQVEQDYTTGAIFEVSASAFDLETKSFELRIMRLKSAPTDLQSAKRMLNRFHHVMATFKVNAMFKGSYSSYTNVFNDTLFLLDTLYYGLTDEDVPEDERQEGNYFEREAKRVVSNFNKLVSGDFSPLQSTSAWSECHAFAITLASAVHPVVLALDSKMASMSVAEYDAIISEALAPDDKSSYGAKFNLNEMLDKISA